jgi:hypothetical protein
VKSTAETDLWIDPRHSGQRSLGIAEGVLVALRHCTLDEAFTDIVQTAKRHNVAPMALAGALAAIAEHDGTRGLDDAVVAAVDRAWGPCWASRAVTLTANAHNSRSRRRRFTDPAGQLNPLGANGDCVNRASR